MTWLWTKGTWPLDPTATLVAVAALLIIVAIVLAVIRLFGSKP